MPKILIKSRAEIEQFDLAPLTALISITDANCSFATLKSEPAHVLRLAFDDVDNDLLDDETDAEKYHMFNDAQAAQIASFYAQIHDKVDTIICQCEHGQSRSAGVAAAILEYQSHNGIDIFASDEYYPNKVVFRKTLQALSKQ